MDKLTETGKANLKILRDYIDGPARELGKLCMDYFWHHENDLGEEDCPTLETYECGTAMCFVGHGPLAGIKPTSKHFYGDGSINFAVYSADLLDIKVYERAIWDNEIWKFLFDHKWPDSYNQCVARADLVLNDKIPEEFKHSDRYANCETKYESV